MTEAITLARQTHAWFRQGTPPAPATVRRAATGALDIALFSGNYNCVRDGANRALNRLIGQVLARGHGARVYSPAIARPAFAPAGELVPVASLALPGRPEYRFAPGLPRASAADVRRFAPHVVHVSAPDGLGAGAIRLARRLNVPVVASMHTRFETYLDYYRLGWLRRPAEAWLRRFYNRCDLVLAPNEGMAEQMRADGITAPLRIWSRGVDARQFSPALRDMDWRASMGIAEHEIAVLFFGRLVAEKGLATFRAVVEGLRSQGLPVRPLVIGDGPERERFGRALGDAVMTGHLDGIALGRAVASADLFVNPSLTEAFGNVTLEAMASGVAVVAADAASTRGLIDHGRSGSLVTSDSVDAYIAAANVLVSNPAQRARFGEAALATASRFRWSETLDAVIDSYRDVVRRHAERGA